MSLPNTYTRLTYIQSSGTQYINTGINFNFSGECSVEYEIKVNNTNNTTCLSGCEASGTNWNFILQQNGSRIRTYHCSLGAWNNVSIDTNTIYTIKQSQVGTTYTRNINGTILTGETNTVVPSKPFVLFADNTGNYGVNQFAYINMYYCKIVNNGILVRDFIPAKRNSDSVLGLYDLVNDVFYTNSGSGTFTAGNEIKTSVNPANSGTVDVSETGGIYTITAQKNSGYKFLNWLLKGYTQLEYIQSNGGNCINTNVKQKYSENIKILFEYEPTYRSDSDYFGANGTTQCAISQSNGWQNNVKSACIVNHTANGNTTITLDGVLKNTFTYSGYDNIPIFLFALGISESGYNYTTKGKLYNAKIYDNSNTLVRDFIPVIRHSDGAIGLLDLVNLKFYGNSGSGSFIAGGVV